jgi:hypothetical protein
MKWPVITLVNQHYVRIIAGFTLLVCVCPMPQLLNQQQAFITLTFNKVDEIALYFAFLAIDWLISVIRILPGSELEFQRFGAKHAFQRYDEF